MLGVTRIPRQVLSILGSQVLSILYWQNVVLLLLFTYLTLIVTFTMLFFFSVYNSSLSIYLPIYLLFQPPQSVVTTAAASTTRCALTRSSTTGRRSIGTCRPLSASMGSSRPPTTTSFAERLCRRVSFHHKYSRQHVNFGILNQWSSRTTLQQFRNTGVIM